LLTTERSEAGLEQEMKKIVRRAAKRVRRSMGASMVDYLVEQ
jgi:hypothetical protein